MPKTKQQPKKAKSAREPKVKAEVGGTWRDGDKRQLPGHERVGVIEQIYRDSDASANAGRDVFKARLILKDRAKHKMPTAHVQLGKDGEVRGYVFVSRKS